MILLLLLCFVFYQLIQIINLSPWMDALYTIHTRMLTPKKIKKSKQKREKNAAHTNFAAFLHVNQEPSKMCSFSLDLLLVRIFILSAAKRKKLIILKISNKRERI